jgi:hypothetical protein
MPAPYTYYAPTTTVTDTRAAFDRLAIIANVATSTPTSISTPTASSSFSQSTEIGTSSNVTIDREEYEPLAMSENSVMVNPIVVTETFSGNQTVQTSEPSIGITDGKPMLVALLTTLRDMLVALVHAIQARPTFGFQAPWQPAQPLIMR